MTLDEHGLLAAAIRRHIAERQERELMLLAIMGDLLAVLRLLRIHLKAEGFDEERPLPN